MSEKLRKQLIANRTESRERFIDTLKDRTAEQRKITNELLMIADDLAVELMMNPPKKKVSKT